jgi:hypothetical protein
MMGPLRALPDGLTIAEKHGDTTIPTPMRLVQALLSLTFGKPAPARSKNITAV